MFYGISQLKDCSIILYVLSQLLCLCTHVNKIQKVIHSDIKMCMTELAFSCISFYHPLLQCLREHFLPLYVGFVWG